MVFCLWIMGFYVAALYDLTLFREPLKLFRSYLEAMLANLGIAFAFFYLLPIFNIAPRTNLFLDFVITLLLGYMWRMFFRRFVLERVEYARVLYIGPVDGASDVYEMLRKSSLGLTLVAAISTQSASSVPSSLPIHWMHGLDRLAEVLKSERIQTIVLGVRLDQIPELQRALYRAIFSSVLLVDRVELEESATGRIPLSHVNETWFLEHLRESDKAWYENTKRAFDVLLAIPFVLFTVFILPWVALAIKLSSPGPIFYTQQRVGKAGKPIRIWKFRTMRVDAEKNGPQFTASTAHDPRVTVVGRWMRQLRIDELPQLWNVIRGDLSFVGPRPERPEFVAPLIEQMPYYNLRHLTRPGLTGWAQVNFLTPTSRLEDNLKKLQYDLFYIKRRSLLLDISILLKTIGIVLRRQGT